MNGCGQQWPKECRSGEPVGDARENGRQDTTHWNWSRERSCGSSVVWAGRGEWNATRGLAVHGARGAQNTYRAHVEGSMGLITLIAVRCSPWCVFILPMHVFPADTYTYRPRSVTSPSRTSLYPRHTHAYMEKQTTPAISATGHCYSSPVPIPCPVPGTHQ
jgi:hypothetical protein